MDTNRLKRFATEARNILMQGVAHRLTALGFKPDGSVTEEPQQQGGGATFMGDTVSQDFYDKWQSLHKAVAEKGINEIAEEAAYTWFNRLMAIRILVKNGLASPILSYESEEVKIPVLVSEARQGRMPEMDDDTKRKLNAVLDDDSKTNEQFALLIVAYCHSNPIINNCFGHISDYTELLLPQNILADGGFVSTLNDTPFITDEDYKSTELIGWLYQFYISEKKDDVFASFKKGKKAEAKDIPAATQIFTPNWIVKYMVQNTVGRIYLDNNPYSDIKDSMQYLVEPEEPTPDDAIFKFDDIHDLTCGDLGCGSGHILIECFDLLFQLYIEEGYSRKNAIEDIFKYNLTGVDIDTRAKQLAQFALLLKACQKDPSFADAHCMPKVLDMPEPYDPEAVNMSLNSACLKFIGGYETVAGELLEQDMELMMDAHNLGSIMKFNDDEDYLAMLRCHYEDWTDGGIDDCPEEIKALLPAVELILTLTKKYAALVMNPPYMGGSNMNSQLSNYVKKNYSSSKSDLFAVFMDVAMERLISKGKYAMINLPSWLFLSTFESLRENLIKDAHIDSLLHMGRGIFGIDWGSVAFAITKSVFNREGHYYRLHQRNFQHIYYFHIQEIFLNSLNQEDYKYDFSKYRDEDVTTSNVTFPHSENGIKVTYRVNQNNFLKIPGTPIGYWVNNAVIKAFNNGNLYSKTISDGQTKTGDNNKYLREVWEVSKQKVGLHKKWLFYAKGGGFRRWYGNLNTTINWSDEARAFYRKDKIARILPEYLWEKEGITWSYICSSIPSFRYLIKESVFDVGGSSVFFKNEDDILPVLGFLNSKFAFDLLKIYNPTINYQVNDIRSLPIHDIIYGNNQISCVVKNNISISRTDWDAHETSWDFQINDLVKLAKDFQITTTLNGEIAMQYPESLKALYNEYCVHWKNQFMQLHSNEEELNRQFIEIYGLQDELTPDVPLDEITILQQGEISIENNQIVWHDDVVMKQLISYAIGCMMGRYSIDKPGLILANQSDTLSEYNELVSESHFDPDDDGIIPLMPSDSDFSDNATLRFKQWLTITFGEQNLVDNLNFIEASLGKSIDNYFVKDFWKDHKKMYQNRPIYWLFSSKKGAFQCIAYMHRMDAYTAERIRTKYLLPHIEWLVQKQNEMEANAANLSTVERKKLDNIRKQIDECREYHDRLHVVADQQIAFDLDDGVVVNYAKFGDVLAKLK